ncbi:hypothetical protein HJC23_008650 [Cyclotella cryptica]|uniref:SET domain-containing protein n=1 Tax=Cyclotella cryptica TaxID=29204 RepID=A0ABD3P6I3_9STRA|eukprot:CCRYP_017192-RA/>CCRYP_017192-RA protein AED:0.01 eAED:0.01 QI:301/-1/1/1/-1/1/1/505/294
MKRVKSRSLEYGIASSRGARLKRNARRAWFMYTSFLASASLLAMGLLSTLIQMQSSLLCMNYASATSTDDLPGNCPRDPTPETHYIPAQDDPKYNMTQSQLANFTFQSLYEHLNCYPHAINQSKPLYTPAMYQHMKDKYTELTGQTLPIQSNDNSTFHISTSEHAGRGVFASRNISKGEILPFDSTCSVVFFDDGLLWKTYVVSLPREMGCDVMEWTWTQHVYVEGNVRLCLSIGEGDSFLNDADLDEDVNIAPTNGTSMKFYAVRDIRMGEELIYDYEVFEPSEYERFGLGRL